MVRAAHVQLMQRKTLNFISPELWPPTTDSGTQ